MALGKSPAAIVASGDYPLLEISPTWERINLGEIATVQNGAPFSSDHFTHGDGMPLIRIRDVGGDSTENFYSGPYEDEFIVKKGDLLVGMDGDFHAAIWKGPDGLLNQRVCQITPKTKLYAPEFLFLTLQPYLNAINAETSSVTVKHLSSRTISEIPLPLPPLPEQKRIVAKIEELFSELEAGEESLRKARRQLGVYRQSLLQQAFEGKLTTKWRTKNSDKLESPAQLLARIQSARQSRYEQQLKEWEAATTKWKADGASSPKPRRPGAPENIDALPDDIASDLADLPSSWFWGKLALMTLGIEYGTAAKSSETGTCPVIRMGNLQRGEIDWDDLVFTSDQTEIAQYRLAPGDVLFNRTNSPELVGKTAVYRGQRPAVFAGYLMRVNHIPSVVCSGYLNYFLNSGVAREYGNSVKTDGVNQSNINGAKLAGYPFPYCSLPEQQEIVRVLDEQFEGIERNEREIDGALRSSAALRQAILQKAFTGRLVPQCADDEPASTLLARLRAEREAAPSPARLGRRKIDQV